MLEEEIGKMGTKIKRSKERKSQRRTRKYEKAR
jgi:hypothetical protein